MIWETLDHKTSGQIHFGDSARQEVAWIDRVARSFKITRPLPAEEPVGDIASKTDGEIISMLGIDDYPEKKEQQ